jgi:hypothetical protein
MKFEISNSQAVDLLRGDSYREWSIQAAEGIADWLETQERFESVCGVEDRAPSLESIRSEWTEYDDGWHWLADYTGLWAGRAGGRNYPVVCKSMLAHIGLDPDAFDAELEEFEIEEMIISYIKSKFEIFTTRYSIVVRGVES